DLDLHARQPLSKQKAQARQRSPGPKNLSCRRLSRWAAIVAPPLDSGSAPAHVAHAEDVRAVEALHRVAAHAPVADERKAVRADRDRRVPPDLARGVDREVGGG